MNDIIQNGLVLVVFIAALAFVIRKYFWTKKATANNKKGCSSSGCGCP